MHASPPLASHLLHCCGVAIFAAPAGTRMIIESPCGAFIDQCGRWSILLSAPISRKTQMHVSPPPLASHLLHCCGAAILAPGEGLEC